MRQEAVNDNILERSKEPDNDINTKKRGQRGTGGQEKVKKDVDQTEKTLYWTSHMIYALSVQNNCGAILEPSID